MEELTEQFPSRRPQKQEAITVRGNNTEALIKDPKKGKAYERLLNRPYEFSVLHPKRETGIIILPAFGGHTGGIPLDLEKLAERYNATIVATQHPIWTFSSEFAVAQFEDLAEQQGFKDVILVGPSLGGTLALEILNDYKKRGGFSFKVKGLVMIGSPTCRADLKPSVRVKLKIAESLRKAMVRAYKLRREPEKVTGYDLTGATQSDAEFHGQIARASVLLREPPKPGNYPDIPVLALTLPPGRDQIVKDTAKNRIKQIFPQAVFETFDAKEHSQEEYMAHAEEIGEKIMRFLDLVILKSKSC